MPYRLEADGLDPFELTPAEGFAVSSFDPGFPVIRTSSTARPDGDGEDDDTRYLGARSVVIAGTIVRTATRTRQQTIDLLRAHMRPDLAESFVYFSVDGSEERRIRLRADSHQAPLTRPTMAVVTAAWRGIDGIQESADAASARAEAAIDDEGGRTYPRTYPWSYADSDPIGVVDVNNDGNVRAYPVLRLYGPCTNPRIENRTTDRALEFGNSDFGDLVLAAGEYVEIDTRERTVLLNSETAQTRRERLDDDTSRWWALEPGVNVVRYYPESFESGSEAVITYRSAWL